MRYACDYAIRMSKMIQIRDVPDELHRKLKLRAVQEGVTLSDLLAREARRLVERPTFEEMRQRLACRPRRKLTRSAASLIREERGDL